MAKKKPKIDYAALAAQAAEKERLRKEAEDRRVSGGAARPAGGSPIRRPGDARNQMKTSQYTLATGAGVSIRGRG